MYFLVNLMLAANIVSGELRPAYYSAYSAAAASDARAKRHDNAIDKVTPTPASSNITTVSAASAATHGETFPATVVPPSSLGGDEEREFRQLVADKGRGGGKAHGVLVGGGGRHHATPLDHTWPSPEKCVRPAKCEPLINASCFGAPLPYTHTTIELANDSSSQFEIQVGSFC